MVAVSEVQHDLQQAGSAGTTDGSSVRLFHDPVFRLSGQCGLGRKRSGSYVHSGADGRCRQSLDDGQQCHAAGIGNAELCRHGSADTCGRGGDLHLSYYGGEPLGRRTLFQSGPGKDVCRGAFGCSHQRASRGLCTHADSSLLNQAQLERTGQIGLVSRNCQSSCRASHGWGLG